MSTRLTHPTNIVKFLRRIVLSLAGIAYLFFLAGSVYEALVFPGTPAEVTLSQAVKADLTNQPDFLVFDQALYVSITDAVWDCTSLKPSGYSTIFSDKRRTDAQFTDVKKTALVYVQVNGFYNCQQLQEYKLAGELQRVASPPDTGPKNIPGTSASLENPALIYNFCTQCTPSNAVFISIFLIGLPIIVWLYFQSRRNRQEEVEIGP